MRNGLRVAGTAVRVRISLPCGVSCRSDAERVSTCTLRECRRPYGCPGKYAPADRINPPGRSFPICRLGIMRETAPLKGQHKLKSFRISAGTVRTGRLPGRFLRPCRNPRRPVRGIWAPVGSLRIWLPAPCRLPHCGRPNAYHHFAHRKAVPFRFPHDVSGESLKAALFSVHGNVVACDCYFYQVIACCFNRPLRVEIGIIGNVYSRSLRIR